MALRKGEHMSIEAMNQALGALRTHAAPHPMVFRAMDALRLAIEQAEKPWVKTYTGGNPNYTIQWQGLTHCDRCGKKLGGPEHIHTCSPQRQWQGLTKKEFLAAVDGLEDLEDCWVAIEAKLKEKNG